ncbi:MAG: 23S rRNA (adenine(2503)-C(2))-methyltransferase RlmN [Victivallales bacterium]|nr:23S rRNA (adenine(2503)-C(2))-methyltransferase RlmN [Victivallales bacterium]
MTADAKDFICTATRTELEERLRQWHQPAFRATQILDWVYHKRIFVPAAMKNLPASLRETLQENFLCQALRVRETQEADDGTAKLLLELPDHETIEAVIIPSPGRYTFCLSTQVGCPVRCYFCASGADGLVRNLLAGEIVEQFNCCCTKLGKLPDNIVFMGIGEGLMNFDNLTTALDLLCSPDGFGLAARRITVSTSGWVPGIRKLADLERQWNLAVSLHAPDDATRAKLIPEPMRLPMADILAACDYYRQKSGRMVTFEYTLIRGINDSRDQAAKLATIALAHHAKVNLIPYNQTSPQFERPTDRSVRAFEAVLLERKVQVTVRVEKGSKVAAACGQLRRHAATRSDS